MIYLLPAILTFILILIPFYPLHNEELFMCIIAAFFVSLAWPVTLPLAIILYIINME